MAGDNELIIRINGTAKDFLDEIDKVKKQTKELEQVLTKTAKVSAAAFLAFAGAIFLVTKSFASYEKALVGVGKTTGIEGKRLDAFGKKFQKLASTIPLTTNTLLGIAQAAGQLGISAEDDLLIFTETIAKLGVATDLSGEQAATALARILNVTKEGIDTIDVFGSVIVRLGNNFAATESEIVRSTTEIAKSTAVFGVSAAQAAALGTALRSLGQQAQLGGSVVGRTFRTIRKVIAEGGTQLEIFAEITGIAGDQLRQTFETDAAGVFQSFIEGLGELEGGTDAIFAALEGFGLKGDEVNKILPVLAKNAALVGDAFAQAADEVLNTNALNEEAAKAFATLDSEIIKVGNNFENLKTNIGEQLAPAITELLVSLNSLLKNFSEMDKEQLSLIASFLKFGAVLFASISTVAVVALGFLKFRALLSALSIAFKVGRIAAIGFYAASTLGLSLILSFLPEIITGISKLITIFSKRKEPLSLIAVNKELKEMQRLRDEIALGPDVGFTKQAAKLKQLDDEIAKLKIIRQERIRATEDFGTGALLLKPEAEKARDLDFGTFGEATIPLKGKVEVDETARLAALKKSEEERTQFVDAKTRDRINKLKRESDVLKAIQRGRSQGLLAEDLEFLSRKAEIEEEFRLAGKIKNNELRVATIANLNLQHEEELEAITEQENLKDEQALERQEERDELDIQLRELSKEQQAQFTEEDKKELQKSVDTKKEITKRASVEKIKTNIAEKNQFKKDEDEFGIVIAKSKAFFRKKEVVGIKQASGQLIALTQSKNSTLKSIGKVAASTNAAIATAEGAIKAYSALAGLGPAGPVLGAAAAAALIAFGIEQQATILSAKHGGFVPPTNGGARDRFPALLEPNELVVPAPIAQSFIQAAGIPDTQGREAIGDQDEGTPELIIDLSDRAGEMITLEQREGRTLGLIAE